MVKQSCETSCSTTLVPRRWNDQVASTMRPGVHGDRTGAGLSSLDNNSRIGAWRAILRAVLS